MAKETLASMLDDFINEQLDQIVLSNPAEKDHLLKVKVILRPLILQGRLKFQAEEFTKTQAFHKNMSAEELKVYLTDQLSGSFKQAEVLSELGSATVLVSKKGTTTVKTRRHGPAKIQAAKTDGQFSEELQEKLQHNRQKRYVIPEGHAVPFLVDLGVQTPDGKVIKSRYDKFRQINRFLEFIEDILPALSREREITILDFGCGKSYLTFAMYYYLKELKGYDVNIIGLDLKEDVIKKCNSLAGKYGYDKLHFLHGDIADYEGVQKVDMVVTLHACDKATDYALAKAVEWDEQVILSVPCCQHELNSQIHNELLEPVLKYGILKERISALLTDGIRAELLESQGYSTQILEFIDMEHTPKNLLIRAVKNEKAHFPKGLPAMNDALNSHLTLEKLLYPDGLHSEKGV